MDCFLSAELLLGAASIAASSSNAPISAHVTTPTSAISTNYTTTKHASTIAIAVHASNGPFAIHASPTITAATVSRTTTDHADRHHSDASAAVAYDTT